MTERIAVIADIHGNIDALLAVFADIHREGVETILNLGDNASGPLAAADTINLLASRSITSISGNCDRVQAEAQRATMSPSDGVAFDQLGDRQIEWLRTLPPTAVHAGEIFLCHGTPASDVDGWLETLSADAQVCLAPIEEIEAAAAGFDYPVLLCGHTHLPRNIRLRDGRRIVNPGSVGLPAYDYDKPVYYKVESGSPDARYAILEKRQTQWQAELRSVAYDPTRMIELARAASRPDWVSALSTGWIR